MKKEKKEPIERVLQILLYFIALGAIIAILLAAISIVKYVLL